MIIYVSEFLSFLITSFLWFSIKHTLKYTNLELLNFSNPSRALKFLQNVISIYNWHQKSIHVFASSNFIRNNFFFDWQIAPRFKRTFLFSALTHIFIWFPLLCHFFCGQKVEVWQIFCIHSQQVKNTQNKIYFSAPSLASCHSFCFADFFHLFIGLRKILYPSEKCAKRAGEKKS